MSIESASLDLIPLLSKEEALGWVISEQLQTLVSWGSPGHIGSGSFLPIFLQNLSV